MIKTINKKIKHKIGLHNEFTIAVTEYETEECLKIKKQWEAKAFNIVLNQGLTKVAKHIAAAEAYGLSKAVDDSRIAMQIGSYNSTKAQYSFGGWIQYGDDNTTPAATDTALGGLINGKQSAYYDKGIDFDNLYSWYTQYITITPSEEIGEVFREVGLAANSNTDLATRALIVDSEGSPLSITKTSTMQITIYSKLYFILDTISFANTDWVNGTAYNDTDQYNAFLYAFKENHPLAKGSDTPTLGESLYARWYIVTGTDGTATTPATDGTVKSGLASSGILQPTRSTYAVSASHRFQTGDSNGKIKEIGLELDCSPDGGSYIRPLFRSVMPVTGVWSGTTFTDVNIGTGDGVEDEFTLGETDQESTFWTWNEINESYPTVKVDGVTQTHGTDYTYNDATGVITFESGSIPANGEAVTASWSVPYIAKSNDYVLDVEFEITIGEGTVPS